ncbi:MAG TPA: M20/M25/M40 family metallo-hydrolase [Terriglobales bacterium]|nr:M20/M25/M40 family metallo-hydrolase [Terriglobales bacterium]
MRKFILFLLILVMASFAVLAVAQNADDIDWRIRKEETENSQIMHTMHYLSDVYGPRLTGSPNLKAAEDWAMKQMTSWGFRNVHLEPWNFVNPGWTNERFSAYLIAPAHARLVGLPEAWTPGTNGPLTADVAVIEPPERPTQEKLAAYLNTVTDAVKGKIVMVGKPRQIPINFNEPAKRRDEADLRNLFDPNNPNAGQFFPRRPQPAEGQDKEKVLTRNEIAKTIDEFLVAHGAVGRINDAGREHGQLISYANETYDLTKAVPTVILRNEDYGRLYRLLQDQSPVRVELNIQNRSYPEGKTAYNVIAEIPGSDKKDEVVMLGGHFDSWHAATGATDNAIGAATMMEAARILKAIGVRPRRTIRVALWTGEEEGIWGSQSYVKQHFGSFENPTPEFSKLDAYLNIDSGTGRARGASVFGPPEAGTIVREDLKPFADLGVVGAVATKSRRIGGTDSTSFNNAGLPGIGFMQDPIEYGTYTHHTDLDTYERILPEDAQASAIDIAAVLYDLATRDDMVPRLTREQMPPPVVSPYPPPGSAPAASTQATQ